jgi:hypothetical protein
MNLPAWLQDLTQDFGTQRQAGKITRQDAVTALRDKILAEDDRPLILGITAEFAGKILDAWQRGHEHQPARGPHALVQAELFPGLPPRLFVRPGVAKPPIWFTAHDWDMARNVLKVRTSGAKDAAEADWAAFDAAYQRVRPLLTDEDMTTADVAEQISRTA